MRFDFDFMTDKDTKKFEKRSVNIVDALNNVFEQVNMMMMIRVTHPVSLFAYCLFGWLLDLKPECAIVKKNCATIR